MATQLFRPLDQFVQRQPLRFSRTMSGVAGKGVVCTAFSAEDCNSPAQACRDPSYGVMLCCEMPNQQQIPIGFLKDVLGDTAEEYLIEFGAPTLSHDDQVGVQRLRLIEDRERRRAALYDRRHPVA